LFTWRASRDLRPLGEALNVGIECHDARGHLLMPTLPATARFENLVGGVDAARQQRAGGAIFYREGCDEPEAYYVTSEALSLAGGREPIERDFDTLAREHAKRISGTGLRVIELRRASEPGQWVATTDGLVGTRVGSPVRKLAATVRARLEHRERS